VTTSRSERIAMTTPVTVSGKGIYTVAFSMPSQYSMESLPLPKDERVHLTQVPAYQAAAFRFNGYFNEEKISKNKERLLLWLKEQGLKPDGEFVIAGYNPPWVPGFLARNEVLVKVL
ncbi:MAG: heme-binding protein, partial [Anaerolineales bacterium]|nr:heme-binding protein [Anaerolineales bacterium]